MDEALRALTLTSHNASVMLCQLRHDEVMMDKNSSVCSSREDEGDGDEDNSKLEDRVPDVEDEGDDEDHVHTLGSMRSHNPLLDL